MLLYAFFLGLFYLVTITAVMRESIFPFYLRWNAVVSANILSLTEPNITTQGKTIYGRTSLTIERGCDAIEPSALFVAGVLAFPAAWRRKVPGILMGTVCLMFLNLVRIISLYYVRLWIPTWFDFLHVQVWQAAFIFLAILFWILWAVWAIRERRSASHVPVATG